MTNVLPDKPSDLIELALSDLKKVEEDRNYEVEMNRNWHTPGAEGVCLVCLAGAVMAKTLGIEKTEDVRELSGYLTDTERRKILAIDYFRMGLTYRGVRAMRLEMDPDESDIAYFDLESYSDSPTKFRLGMETIVKQLRGEGL